MIILDRTYEDFNGVERTEKFMFHFNEVELMEMEASETGGLDATINRIVEAQDNKEIIRLMKDVLLKSYGKKSDDGRSFIKNDKIRAEFEASPVFPQLFMEFSTDADKAAKFFEGILPKTKKPNNVTPIEKKQQN